MNIVIALVIFSVIVIIHELGHFLLARLNGIEVTEFSLGMGPRVITVVKTERGIRCKMFASSKYCETKEEWRGRTMYSLKILPFGGSCIMLGEDEVVDANNAFCNKSVYARMSVVFAGPLFNFLLAFILSIIIIAIAGFDKPLVVSVDEGMPMQEAGVQAGDEIVSINGTSINIDREISTYFQFNPLKEGDNVEITAKHDGKEYTVNVKPENAPIPSLNDGLAEGAVTDSPEPAKSCRIGFTYGSARQKGNALEVLKYSYYEVKYSIVTTVKSLGMLVTGQLSKDDIAGPVGIVNIVGNIVDKTKDYGISSMMLTLISFSILISANLGVMNLLPIPALDGGRLLFQIVEVIRRKPINPDKEGLVTMIGFVALMILMVLVLFNDISKIFA